MHIEEHGVGPRVFLAIHGWGGDHRDFAPLAARLPPDARLLSVDLPGYGRSPAPPPWDLESIVRELTSDLAARDLSDITLIGFCSGAVLALFVARSAPERVRRIAMIEPFAFIPWYFRIFLAGEFGRRAYRTAFASPLGRSITTWILRRRQSTDDNFMAAFGRVDHDVTQAWLRMFRGVDPLRLFAGLTVPIDIAMGDHTFAAVRESARRYLALWPQARLHELRHVGHLPLVRGTRQLVPIVFGAPEAAPAEPNRLSAPSTIGGAPGA